MLSLVAIVVSVAALIWAAIGIARRLPERVGLSLRARAEAVALPGHLSPAEVMA